ncbi:hypothetical protein D3C76_1278710 [compost metagenome]
MVGSSYVDRQNFAQKIFLILGPCNVQNGVNPLHQFLQASPIGHIHGYNASFLVFSQISRNDVIRTLCSQPLQQTATNDSGSSRN